MSSSLDVGVDRFRDTGTMVAMLFSKCIFFSRPQPALNRQIAGMGTERMIHGRSVNSIE